jgi:hypothetical protein
MDSFCKQTLMVRKLWFRRSLLYEQQLRTPKMKEDKTWLAHIQDNVPEWADMRIRGLLFQ